MARQCSRKTGALRAKHHKSRRGCQTCKIRRIRCDETIPHCRNCASSGRICEGVATTKFTFVAATPSPPKLPTTLLIQPDLSLPGRGDDERRSFTFFLLNAAPLFALGSLDSEFWSRLIPQLSKVHPTVWDATIAIGLLFENPLDIDHQNHEVPNRKVSPQQLKALKWYSRAVSRVAHRSDLGAGDEVSALLTCVLFTALELQQGNMWQAMSLLEKGVELLFTYLQGLSAGERSRESKAIAEVVVPFFSRHAVFVATLGLPLLSGWPNATKVNPQVESEQEALKVLDRLMVQLHNLIFRAHHLIRSTLLILHDKQETSRLRMASRQQALLADLKKMEQGVLFSRGTTEA